jgi:K+-sensing histidine kinase KdpD
VLYLPLKAPMQTRGVLAVEPRAWRALAEPELRRQADVFATLIAIAIERCTTSTWRSARWCRSNRSGCAVRCWRRCRTICARR